MRNRVCGPAQTRSQSYVHGRGDTDDRLTHAFRSIPFLQPCWFKIVRQHWPWLCRHPETNLVSPSGSCLRRPPPGPARVRISCQIYCLFLGAGISGVADLLGPGSPPPRVSICQGLNRKPCPTWTAFQTADRLPCSSAPRPPTFLITEHSNP